MASRFVMPTADVGKGLTPSDGAKLSFFITGTSTPKDTFTTQAATVPNANPVIADSNGVFPDIFITGTYKVTLTDKNDVQSGFGEADPVSETIGVGDANNDKRYGPIFATVAAMVAANPESIDGEVVILVAGMTVQTQGYTTAGDGGGASYLVVASQAADEFGDHTAANGTVLVIQNPERSSQYGTSTGSDQTSELQAAITAVDDLTIDTDVQFSTIALRGSTSVTVDAEISGTAVDAVTLTSIFGTELIFTGKGKLSGDGVTSGQSGIVLNSAINCKVVRPFVDLFLNKGIDLKGATTDCEVFKPRVRGATGATGAGVSMFGSTCQRNRITQPDCSFNRLGVTINGAGFNHVDHPVANSCTGAGVVIDGIITDAGDGGTYNKIDHPICNNGTDATLGGIFCGNGSSYNEIIHPICIDNAGAGIRFSGGVGFENESNRIIDPICSGNAVNGITLSFCPRMSIRNPTCIDNTGRGIADLDCDGLKVIGGFVDGNTNIGIVHQSPRTFDSGVTVTNNGTDGINIAFGGTLGLADNRSAHCHVSGNSGVDYVTQTGLKAWDMTGYVVSNRGSDTKTDGQTIAHGLSETPNNISATGSVAGEIITVTAIGATTFTVAIKQADGTTSGTSQAIYWEADLYE